MTRPAVIPWSADDIAEALRDRYRAEPEGNEPQQETEMQSP